MTQRYERQAREPGLPHELIPRLGRQRLLVIWGLVVLVFVVVNLVVAQGLAARGYNRGYHVIQDKWRRLMQLDAPVDYLILGDSSCNQGIDPELLSERLGGTAVNLCTVGAMGLVEDAWMLEVYLQRFPPPKAVLLVHVYDIWNRSDSKLRRAIWNLDSAGVAWQGLSPRLTLSARERFDRHLGPWLPLYSQDQTLRRLLETPKRLAVPPPVITALGFQIETEANPDRVAEDTQAHLAILDETQLRLSDADKKALRALGKSVHPSRTPLIYVSAPVYTGLHQSPQYRVRSQAIASLIELLSSDHPTLEMLASEAPHFPPRQMQNADHVTLPAAHAYTEWIATRLLERRARFTEGASSSGSD